MNESLPLKSDDALRNESTLFETYAHPLLNIKTEHDSPISNAHLSRERR